MNTLKKEIDLLKRKYNAKIDSLDIELNINPLTLEVKDSISEERLKFKCRDWVLKRSIGNECLSKSNQTYFVVEKDLREQAFTGFNKKSGDINILLRSHTPISLRT